MKIWLNIWRHSRGSLPYDVTVHASEEDAIEAIADDIEDDAGAYACTVLIDPGSLDAPMRLDLSDAAHEVVEDRRIERETETIEGRMLRWRQAGV
jgi:CBS domain containing-hemolysin-like protein